MVTKIDTRLQKERSKTNRPCTKHKEHFMPVEFETTKFDNFYCTLSRFIKI